MKTHQIVHPEFRLNGLDYGLEELKDFLPDLQEAGAPHEAAMADFLLDWFSDSNSIKLKTSGSTGKPKKLVLSKSSMIHSAKTTGEALELAAGTEALLCLSPEYIAGKMMLVRALVLGWHLHVVAPSNDALVEYDSEYDFAALVPYQVLTQLNALNKVGKILIGGGPVSKSLEALLQPLKVKAYASYGMTETVSHVALRLINGPEKSYAFKAVSGVSFSTDSRDCLVIHAPEITPEPLVTNDMVTLEDQQTFTWLGRFDNIINSGGVKINPETVEHALSGKISAPYFIASEPDDLLGQRIILVVESPPKKPASTGITQDIFQDLPKYSHPKKIYGVSRFLYTETGKIRRKEVLKLLKKYR